MRHSQWAWPVLESLHFIGMSVLIGTIGLFDLRLLGFARGVPYAALHRLIPRGIAAYTLNLLTGLCFLSGTPDQYLFNLAFRFKVTFMAVAGLNVVFFYTRVFRRLQALAPDSPAAVRRARGRSRVADDVDRRDVGGPPADVLQAAVRVTRRLASALAHASGPRPPA